MDLQAKKSLGQNFLTSTHIVDQMVEHASVSKEDIVLEIGPGKGILTQSLLTHGATVLAIEKDERMVEHLNEIFKKEIKNKKLIILSQDVTEFNPNTDTSLKNKSYKIVANIPYNITGKILSQFLSGKNKPISMTLMVQYEVAKRILARDNKESILSISVKVFGKPELVRKVAAGAFNPKPNVDSAILHIADIQNTLLKKNKTSEERFFSVVKTGFAHKRKKLLSNLKELGEGGYFAKKFTENNISENVRPEDLNLKDWITLST